MIALKRTIKITKSGLVEIGSPFKAVGYDAASGKLSKTTWNMFVQSSKNVENFAFIARSRSYDEICGLGLLKSPSDLDTDLSYVFSSNDTLKTDSTTAKVLKHFPRKVSDDVMKLLLSSCNGGYEVHPSVSQPFELASVQTLCVKGGVTDTLQIVFHVSKTHILANPNFLLRFEVTLNQLYVRAIFFQKYWHPGPDSHNVIERSLGWHLEFIIDKTWRATAPITSRSDLYTS